MTRFIPPQEMVQLAIRAWIDAIARQDNPAIRRVQSIRTLAERPMLLGHIHATGIGDYDLIVDSLKHHPCLSSHNLALHFDRDLCAFVVEPHRPTIGLELPA